MTHRKTSPHPVKLAMKRRVVASTHTSEIPMFWYSSCPITCTGHRVQEKVDSTHTSEIPMFWYSSCPITCTGHRVQERVASTHTSEIPMFWYSSCPITCTGHRVQERVASTHTSKIPMFWYTSCPSCPVTGTDRRGTLCSIETAWCAPIKISRLLKKTA
jgi:hypothetical protein